MKTIKRSLSVLVASSALLGSWALHAQAQDVVMPKPRTVSTDEQLRINETIFSRFQQSVPRDARYLAAGQFRFVHHKSLHYIERTDLGSVGWENPRYGIASKALDPSVVSVNVLLPRMEESLKRAGLSVAEFKFSRFLDEFAGAAQPFLLPKGFDPRKSGNPCRTHRALRTQYSRDARIWLGTPCRDDAGRQHRAAAISLAQGRSEGD
jgi:hypothetical protein